jgi:hypothetical protein
MLTIIRALLILTNGDAVKVHALLSGPAGK